MALVLFYGFRRGKSIVTGGKGVEMSVDPADTSVCATVSHSASSPKCD